MTEHDWMVCADDLFMVNYLFDAGNVSSRKLWLLLCAFLRSIWHYLPASPDIAILDVVEERADHVPVDEDWRFHPMFEQLKKHLMSPTQMPWQEGFAWSEEESYLIRASLTAETIHPGIDSDNFVWGWEGVMSVRKGLESHPLSAAAWDKQQKLQSFLCREVFGNPFRPRLLNSAWLTWNGGTVRVIARAIYDERAFDRMPILADALEDAGCDNAEILHHCREPGEHVRGCWVVDLLLGKS